MANLAAPEIARSIITAKGGPSQLNKYRVIMPSLFIGGDAISMDVLCRGASLPGRTNNVINRQTNFKMMEMPAGYENTPFDLQFTETNDHTVNHYFNTWMNAVTNPDTYEVAWRDDIVRDIIVMSNDGNDIPNYVCRIKNAYPKFKNPVELSDTSNDTVMEVRVQFAYEDFEIIDSIGISGISDLVRSVKAGRILIPSNLARQATQRLGGFI